MIVLVALAYSRVGAAGFVNLDDDAYVEFAPMVNHGVRPASLVWAFTSEHSSNWHPLTSISHMIDCDLFGLRPGLMHWENVLWHILNTALVIAVWHRFTRRRWAAFAVGALFALHPLHVESVAWISERKDVLSTFWWLVGLLAYKSWIERPSPVRYLAVVGALVAALLSKPMAVTFPFTLLLLDYWPLARWPAKSWQSLVREKLPLFLLVGLHSAATYLVQSESGAARYAERFTFGARVENAFVSFVRYLGDTVWPERLAPLYFHPGHWPFVFVVGSVAFFVAMTSLAWWQGSSRPWFAFGWLWFLGTLVPVIGIVQVGAQSMADRYTYVPLLGIFTILAFAGAELCRMCSGFRKTIIAAFALLLAALSWFTFRQTGVWHDSVRLYRHSIEVGEDHAGIRYLLATALQAQGQPEAAVIAQFKKAAEVQPNYVNAWLQLAAIDARHGQLEAARQKVQKTLGYEPRNPQLHFNLAMVLQWEGHRTESRGELEETVRLDPHAAGAWRELAQLDIAENRWTDALRHYEALVESDRWNGSAITEYGNLLANTGNLKEAERFLRRAIWIDPANTGARQSLAIVQDRLRASGG